MVDIETGHNAGQLHPSMAENPSFRWAFIRKVYTIIAAQLFVTTGVAATVIFVPPLSRFLVTTPTGLAIYIVTIVTLFITMCLLFAFHQRHPLNFILLAFFTVLLASIVGISCTFVKGKIILEAVILTFVMVLSLTLYTFWAANKGYDFNFLGPFLLAGFMVLLVFAIIQIFLPLGKVSIMIYGLLFALLSCGYIVYDTDNLIKRYTYDQYIIAAASLYIDIMNLFVALLTLFNAADN